MVRQQNADTATVLELVGRIYEAAVDPELWPRFLNAFAEATDSDATLIWLRDSAERRAPHRPAPSFDGNAAIDPVCQEGYADHVTHVNALLEAVDTVPEGTIVTFRRPGPHRAAEVAAGLVLRQGSTVAVFSASRGKRYGDRERRLVGRLMPHLRCACLLHRRLTRMDVERSSGLAALDLLPTAVWLLDAQGCLVFANRAGRELDRNHDGIWLHDDGSPAADDPVAQQALRRIVAGALAPCDARCGPDDAGIRVRRRRSGTPLQVMVHPLPQGIPTHRSAAAMLIFDPARGAIPDERALRMFYGLTLTESHLAAALSRGDSLNDYCRANEVSFNTARTHLKSVLAKTGTHRQAQLVSLLANLPAAVPARAVD